MKCAHCGKPKADNKWTVQVCADGRKKRIKYLCDLCDMKLNMLVLKFMNDPNAGTKVMEYGRTRKSPSICQGL